MMVYFISILCLLLASVSVSAQLAFPTAEGYGASTTSGGRAGAVIYVDNLNDTGTGSLRAAMTATGARTVIFRVGGTITLTSGPIHLNNASMSNLTVAGQTAPGDGILLKNYGLKFTAGVDNVVIRHLRIRLGGDNPASVGDQDMDGILVFNNSGTVENYVFDHLSVSWSWDENFQTGGGIRNVTLQNSIISEGCSSLVTCPRVDMEANHSMGVFIFGADTNKTFSGHGNLLIHNQNRNPRITGGGRVDWRNNLVYNWDFLTVQLVDGTTEINFVGNNYVPGDDSPAGNTFWLIDQPQLFLDDNFTQVCPTGNANDWTCGIAYTNGVEVDSRTDTPFSVPTITTLVTSAVEASVLGNAGAGAGAPFGLDAVDSRLISEFNSKTGSVGIGSAFPTIASGTPYTDADGDGIDDAWESLCSTSLGGLNPADGTDGNDIITGIDAAVDGYSKLDVYINELAGDYELNSCGGVVPIAPYTILKTASGITVDGSLAEFADANPIVFGGGNGNETTVRLMWNDVNLYIGAITTDTELNATDATHDSSVLWRDDSLEFVIDTENNGGWDVNDYKIIASALGTTFDARNLTDITWEDTYAQAVVLVNDLNTGADDTSWSVEIEIPWTSLGMSPVADDVVSINFQVNDLDSTRIPYSWNGNINTIADAVEVTFSATEIGDDTTAPTGVAITSPADAATVRGIVQISSDAVDETAMSHVVFTRVGAGVPIGIDSTGPEPWTISWNTHTVLDGSHDLRVEAFDTSNNSTVSADITVTVDNVTLTTVSGVPTSPSTSAAAAPTFPGVPTSPSTSSASTPSLPGVPTSPSTSASGAPTFPGPPTGAIIP